MSTLAPERLTAITSVAITAKSFAAFSFSRVSILLPGLSVSAGLGMLAMGLAQLDSMQRHGMGALTIAILLGMLIGNTAFPRMAAACAAGVVFSKQNLLRVAIVLYGLRLTFQDVGQVGLGALLIDALMLSSTFALALLLGLKLLKLDRATVILIGAGSAICGAAAVMATEPVLRARSEKVAVAVATVMLFGSIAMFLYPLLYSLNQQWQWLPGSAQKFGIYLGSSMHEVAQVVAAGRAISPEVANAAVITKMLRVMMLAPFLLLLSAYLLRAQPQGAGQEPAARLAFPWFTVGFMLVTGLNSVALLAPALVRQLIAVDNLLMAMAMAALGLGTQLSAIRQAGIKPLLLGALLLVWLMAGGATINQWVMRLLA